MVRSFIVIQQIFANHMAHGCFHAHPISHLCQVSCQVFEVGTWTNDRITIFSH